MPRKFKVPIYYRSSSIASVKRHRQSIDPKKRDLSPSIVDFGPIQFLIPRHFGFCFGVENAIEIAYKAIDENPNKRIFLLSEMIHNQEVNSDLKKKGVGFLMNTSGETIIPFSELSKEDVVIVPAFGTTVEIQKQLEELGIDPYYYDTTCPFVEKVWKRAADLGKQDFTVVVHGKSSHEETRATFSHSVQTAPTIVVLNMEDTKFLIDFMKDKVPLEEFKRRFNNRLSVNFDPTRDLTRIGVVNQTTMLATETQEIATALKQAMIEIYGEENISKHFADTRDTLCYATYENQNATRELIRSNPDLAIVVGGYNSSNTSHLVELCEEKMPTFYVKNADEIINQNEIKHFDLESKSVIKTSNWLPKKADSIKIAITSGASCPDSLVDQVVEKISGFYQTAKSWDLAFEEYREMQVNR